MKKPILLSLLLTFSMALFAQNNHKTVFSVEAGGTYYYSLFHENKNTHYSGDILLSAYFTPKFKLSVGFSYAMEHFKKSYVPSIMGVTKETIKLNANYLQIPILASFTLKQKTNYSFSLFGGVIFKHLSRFHYSRALEYELHTDTYHADIEPHPNASTFFTTFVLGCTFSPRIGKQLRLNISPYFRFPHPKDADLLPVHYVLYDHGNRYLNKHDICLKVSLEYTFWSQSKK